MRRNIDRRHETLACFFFFCRRAAPPQGSGIISMAVGPSSWLNGASTDLEMQSNVDLKGILFSPT